MATERLPPYGPFEWDATNDVSTIQLCRFDQSLTQRRRAALIDGGGGEGYGILD